MTFQIDNCSGATVCVALAVKHLIASGWWRVQPNQTMTITEHVRDLHLRLQSASGEVMGSHVLPGCGGLDLHVHLRSARDDREITFGNFNNFLWFPVSGYRFTVSKEGDDTTLRRGKHCLEKRESRAANQPLPGGWWMARFFKVGPGNHRVQIQCPQKDLFDYNAAHSAGGEAFKESFMIQQIDRITGVLKDGKDHTLWSLQPQARESLLGRIRYLQDNPGRY